MSRVRGKIWIGESEIDASGAIAYHDDTFGSWNFLFQPFFWFSFSGEKYHILFADMYKEGKNRIYGLKIFDKEKNIVHSYLPGTYSIQITNTKKANSFKFDAMSKQVDNFSFSIFHLREIAWLFTIQFQKQY